MPGSGSARFFFGIKRSIVSAVINYRYAQLKNLMASGGLAVSRNADRTRKAKKKEDGAVRQLVDGQWPTFGHSGHSPMASVM